MEEIQSLTELKFKTQCRKSLGGINGDKVRM